MVGSSETSRNGDIYAYYVCSGRVHGRKKLKTQNKTCTGRNIAQKQLEEIVYNNTIWLLSDSKTISKITESVIAYYKNKPVDTEMEYWELKLRGISKKIHNLVKAIEAGVASETVIAAISKYEKEKKKLK